MNTTMKMLATGTLVLATTLHSALAKGTDDSAEVSDKSSAAKETAKCPPKVSRMYVAIDKFDNKAGAEANQFGTIRARIQEAVVGTRKFEVVEREQLKNALSEQNLIAAGMTNGNDPNAPQSGKLKAAGYVIYGNVLFYGIDKSSVVVEGAGAASVRTKVELQIKITNAETGKIMAQKSIVGAGNVSRIATESSSTAGNLLEQSERMAVANAAHCVVDALRDVCYPAKIIKIGKKECMVNMTDAEVKLGDQFDVVEAGEEMFDPDTGASLGSDGEVVGRIQISRPGPKISAGKATGYWDLDEHEWCEFKLKELDSSKSYIVRRVSAERIDLERKDKVDKTREDEGSRF